MIKQFFCLGIFSILIFTEARAQDNCASAVTLCANSLRSSTTVGATTTPSDPALSCGDMVVDNSVWFTILAVNNGTCTVTVTNINNNPGLNMEVYTGTCGALVTTGQCSNGSSLTGGTMNVVFATVAGTTYYVMVEGDGGNQETFDINASTPNDAIVARPDANFDVNPSSGCGPLTSILDNTTILHGGSNITYEWRIDLGSYFPSSGADTSLTIASIGTHTVTFRVCNLECGCKTVSQDIIVQDLFPVISYNPPTACVGTEIFFDGTASVLPDPPNVDPNITDWSWDFGDPASGVDNTANGQNVSHIFTNSSTTYNVRLIVQGTCGPDTTFTTINLFPEPLVTITGPTEICEGEDLNLSSSVSNAALPITYDWIGVGTFSCTNCPATTVTGLPFGGPYNILLSITDSLGCTADTSIDVVVHELPTVFAGGFIQVCHGDSAQLDAIPAGGLPPYSYLWTPAAGLISSDTIQNPYTFNTASTSYCVTVTDSRGCTSTPDCVNIDEYFRPGISPSSVDLCTTNSPLDNTFTVVGPNPGSIYTWGLSPSYSFIVNAAGDSSSVTATFPPLVASYDFTVIVTDGVTGCIDTVSTTFNVDSGLTMSVAGPSAICTGDTASLSASGADTYVWTANPVYTFTDSSLAVQNVSPTVTTTFTVTGTQGSCTQELIYVLTVGARPDAVINPLSSFCGCDTVSLDGLGSTPGMVYNWTSTSGSVIAAPSSIVTTAIVCGPDSFFLQVTDTATGCFRDTFALAIPNPNPAAQVSVLPDTICNGVVAPVTLDGTGSNTDPLTTYHWTSSDPSVIIADTTIISTTSTVSTAVTFFLTVTDSLGCDSTASDAVSIFPPPTINAAQPFICTTDTVLEATITITGASSGSNYNWTSVPACVVPNFATTASQLFDFAACGAAVYTFDVTVTDSATTCVTSLSQNVTVLNGVVLTVSPDTAFCEGGTAVLYASGANSFLWSTSDTTDTVMVSGLTSAGSPYSFIVTGTVGSCTDTDTILVTVNPIPATGPISGDTLVCENDPASVYTVSPGGGNYTWSVTGGTIVAGQGTANVVINWNSLGIGNVSVVDTNGFGCAGPLQVLNVMINPLPDTPSVTGPDTVCSNAFETYFVNPTAGSTYYWTIIGGSYTGGQTGTVNTFQWGVAGTGTLDVYEVSIVGCAGPSEIINVTINPRPLPVTISGNSLVCDNVSEIYTVSANPGSSYSWTVFNSTQDTLNPTTDTLTVEWGIPGLGQINVFETNAFGCASDTTSFMVNINQHPQITLLSDSDTLCNNTPYQIVAATTPATIHWYTDGTGTFNDTTIASPIYTPSPTDTGIIHLYLVAMSIPCANDTAVVVLNLIPSPNVTVTGPAGPICYGTLDSLRATGGGTYIWTPGGIPGDIIGIRPLVTTTYTVAVTNSYNCTTYDSITVTVIPPGIPDGGSDQIVCISDPIVLNGTQQNAGGLLWSTLGDGVFVPDSTSSTVNYVSGANDTVVNSVNIILTTTGACLNLSDTVNIIIEHYPVIAAGNDTTIYSEPSSNATIPLQPSGLNISGVLWTSSGTGTFDPSDTTLNATYIPSATDYELDSVVLTVTTAGSCSPATDFLVIKFAPFFVPNVFTPYPASPGQNDYFVIRFLIPNTKLKVWDRWGAIVYTSDYYQNDWDAYGLKSDVYFYIVVADEKEYKGWVQVMREE